MIRPGLDKLRYEHLKAFVGHLNEPLPDEERFCKNLACLITIILRGQEPSELLPALRDNEIIAIPKGHTDVRPIGIGLTAVYERHLKDNQTRRCAGLYWPNAPAPLRAISSRFPCNSP